MVFIIAKIRKELEEKADKKIQKRIKRFFKEASMYFGVEIAFLRKNANNYWREIKIFR